MRLKSLFTIIAVFCIALVCQPAFSLTLEEEAKFYREKGYQAQTAGRIDDAISHYKTSIILDPTIPAVYNDLGIVYEINEALDLAERCYYRAITVDSNYLPAYTNLAFLYEKEADVRRAAFYWKKRIELGGPDDPWVQKAHDNLRRLAELSSELKNELEQEAIEKLQEDMLLRKKAESEKVVELSGRHIDKGKDYMQNQVFNLAKKEFYAALLLTPDNSEAIELYKKAQKEEINIKASRGMELYESGDSYSARREFEGLLSIIPAESDQE